MTRSFPPARARWIAVGVAAAALAAAGCGSDDGDDAAASGDAGAAITTPTELKPFAPGDGGEKPSLPGVIGYAQDSPRGFQQLVASGLKDGAEDAGLELRAAQSNGDAQKQVQNMQQFLVQGVGALVTGPVDPTAQTPVMQEALNQGVYMGSIVFGPGSTQANASQSEFGKALATLAKQHIESELGGKANVVLLNQDSVEPIRPRFEAIREVLKTVPGVDVVADVEPKQQDNANGFETMTTVLQKEPRVDVVLGADAVVEGALAAIEAAHKERDDQFLGGVDCEEQALAEIEKGGAYKACVATSPAIIGYTFARYAGDWLAGKKVPLGVCVRPKVVSSPDEARRYQEDSKDPAAVFGDPQRLDEYVTLWGEISYATRGAHLAYPWSPEAC